MKNNVVDVTMSTAQALLIDESMVRPVLVDFWASWCEPCKNLMPILEKIASEYESELLLAKVNADEEQSLAAQFGVRSLPTVMLIKDGQPVDGFAGLKSEQDIRSMLEKYLPSPWNKILEEAKQLEQQNNLTEAYSVLRQACLDSNHESSVALASASIAIKLKRLDEAANVLSDIKMSEQDGLYERVLAELNLAKEAQKAPELQTLEAEYARSPEDNELALRLAVQNAQAGYHEDALGLLFEILGRDMKFKDGEAKKTFLDILSVLGKADPIAVRFQRKLFTLLY